MATIHELKTWPEYYEAVALDKKRFEVRKDDRPFEVGDTLRLMEWNPKSGHFTGRKIDRGVTYILRGMGLQDGYCAMSLTRI